MYMYMTQETVKFDTLNYQEMFFDTFTLQISSKRIAFFVFYTKILFFISTVLSKFFFFHFCNIYFYFSQLDLYLPRFVKILMNKWFKDILKIWRRRSENSRQYNGQKDKQWCTKCCRENWRLSIMNPAINRLWTQVFVPEG